MSIKKNEVSELKQTFDDYKHVDEEGKEYWNARELSKAMGYQRYQYFEPAIERAKQQMISTGKNPDDHMLQSQQMVNLGSGSQREVRDIKLDKYAAYNIAMNADPSKTEVAFAQEYFLQSTAKVEQIVKRLNDKEYIDARDNLKEANKKFSTTLLQHDVKEEELGVVHDAGDRGMFGKGTKQLKIDNNIPDNRPTADFLGAEMAVAKTFAQNNTRHSIERQNANGVKECSDIAFDENQKVANLVRQASGQEPEALITGEDVKKVERRYKALTTKQLKAIEQEF